MSLNFLNKPTLVLNEARTRRNIARMAEKARSQNVRFRPHFKTHQSAEIGEWFRAEGVTAITVSSVDMAQYFAAAGWTDILIAFPVNWHQMEEVDNLARQVQLGLLVESTESATYLAEHMFAPADVWIKVDTGAHRTGIDWQNTAQLSALAKQLHDNRWLTLRGLLTHAGNTYGTGKNASEVYAESVARINAARQALMAQGLLGLEISVGDTPGCSLSPSLGQVDEIRPGNFVFFDAEQYTWGTCQAEDIAVAVACPIVALHPERSEVVVYGGAIHLSKDFMRLDDEVVYGLVALPEGTGWAAPLPGAVIRGLSQEHGILKVRPDDMAHFKIGGWVYLIPAHSCLTVSAMRRYRTLDGEWVDTFNS